jgi:hypothetical protein
MAAIFAWAVALPIHGIAAPCGRTVPHAGFAAVQDDIALALIFILQIL